MSTSLLSRAHAQSLYDISERGVRHEQRQNRFSPPGYRAGRLHHRGKRQPYRHRGSVNGLSLRNINNPFIFSKMDERGDFAYVLTSLSWLYICTVCCINVKPNSVKVDTL